MRRRTRKPRPKAPASPAKSTREQQIENAEVARVLREIGDLLELEGANAFRVRAYRNAARNIEELPQPVESFIGGEKVLTDIPGIGEDLAEKITEIARTGTHSMLRKLERKAPKGAVELMHVRGIGPRRARTLSEKLKIRSVKDLGTAARGGRVQTLRGFGAKTETAILRELAVRATEERRMLRPSATQYGAELLAYLRHTQGVRQAELAGSFRRCRETVGDLDVLVASSAPALIVERFATYPKAEAVLARGRTRAAIRLRSGLRIDLRVVDEASFGSALHYFTGSKAHNIAVRRLGQARGLKLNEYGVFRGKRRLAGATEEEVFDAVGLPWIPPELRENNGELEAAAQHKLPRLVTLDDIRGDLQCHTTDSDGRDSLQAMATAAQSLGYEYLAITDHSPAVRVATGLDAAGFRKQWRRIDALNAKLDDLTLLRGVEVDIHRDGTLDLDDRVLAGFDIALASIHSYFSLPAAAQTARILRALAHPAVDILAHPLGRQIGRRGAMDCDLDQIIRAAAEEGVWLEIDAQPERLDLDDVTSRHALTRGATVVIDSDAHSTAELGFMQWGVDQARRGWVEPRHVANSWPLERVLRSLRRARRSAA
ncbi:MAG: DNA polymerase/3'-5' exonuclease PolX [Gemmatimonadota bacterium]